MLAHLAQFRDTSSAHSQLASAAWFRFVDQLMVQRNKICSLQGRVRALAATAVSGELSGQLADFTATMYRCAAGDALALEHYRKIHSRLVDLADELKISVRCDSAASAREFSPTVAERLLSLLHLFVEARGDCFAHRFRHLTERFTRNLLLTDVDLEMTLRGVVEMLEAATAALLFGAAPRCL